jgi:hypothetical protein
VWLLVVHAWMQMLQLKLGRRTAACQPGRWEPQDCRAEWLQQQHEALGEVRTLQPLLLRQGNVCCLRCNRALLIDDALPAFMAHSMDRKHVLCCADNAAAA